MSDFTLESAQLLGKTHSESQELIATLMREHDAFIAMRDQLEELNSAIKTMNNQEEAQKEIVKLTFLAEAISAGEPHHVKEEDLLFPNLVRLGAGGPVACMESEHAHIRRNKSELLKLVKSSDKQNWEELLPRLDAVVKDLSMTLRMHIQKENNVLYPLCLEIFEQNLWEDLYHRSIKIGSPLQNENFIPPPR